MELWGLNGNDSCKAFSTVCGTEKGLRGWAGGADPDLPGSSTEEGALEHDSYIPGWGNCLYFLETPGVQSSWNVGQEGRTWWMKGEGGWQRLHLEGPFLTLHICPEVNENPGRDFNLGERWDPVCDVAWSPWQRCGTSEPWLGTYCRNLGRARWKGWPKAVLGGQRPWGQAARFEAWHHDFLAGQPWTGYLTSLCLKFFTCSVCLMVSIWSLGGLIGVPGLFTFYIITNVFSFIYNTISLFL